jgi:DNA-binding transcriptional ArsR family regulator
MANLERRDINDPKALRALAHPLRLRLLDELRFNGPATATALAKRLGESSGATSFHLRQLAQYGFIEEDPGHGRGRERWWRPVAADLRFAADPEPSAELRAVGSELLRHQVARDRRVLDAFIANHERYRDWDEAALFSSSAVRLTKAELTELGEEIIALVQRYWREPGTAPPDAEPVALMFYGIPWPFGGTHDDDR